MRNKEMENKKVEDWLDDGYDRMKDDEMKEEEEKDLEEGLGRCEKCGKLVDMDNLDYVKDEDGMMWEMCEECRDSIVEGGIENGKSE